MREVCLRLEELFPLVLLTNSIKTNDIAHCCEHLFLLWEYLQLCVRTKAMQKQLRFVVVGAGSIGREFALRHLVAANGAAVCAIVDPNRAAREALAADVAAAQRGARVEGTE